jgi:hypothetical protein
MNSAAKPAGMSGVRHRQHQDKVADLEEGGMGWRSAGSVAVGDWDSNFRNAGRTPSSQAPVVQACSPTLRTPLRPRLQLRDRHPKFLMRWQTWCGVASDS